MKRIDKLGRIVLPIEMRKCYGIALNESVEIIPTEDGILIKKGDKKGITGDDNDKKQCD